MKGSVRSILTLASPVRIVKPAKGHTCWSQRYVYINSMGPFCSGKLVKIDQFSVLS